MVEVGAAVWSVNRCHAAKLGAVTNIDDQSAPMMLSSCQISCLFQAPIMAGVVAGSMEMVEWTATTEVF